jgi:CBS domain-containing protein
MFSIDTDRDATQTRKELEMTVQTRSILTAGSVMTRDPISVEPTTDARELARVLADNDISGVPVIDLQDRVVGVVSKTDLLRWCVTGGLDEDLLGALGNGPRTEKKVDVDLGVVEDFMSSQPLLATSDEPVTSLARRMVEERVHRIIVVNEDGCLSGIVTSLDLLRAFAQ